MTVNVENMRKWVERLRDPEAKQACDVSELAEYMEDGTYLQSQIADCIEAAWPEVKP